MSSTNKGEQEVKKDLALQDEADVKNQEFEKTTESAEVECNDTTFTERVQVDSTSENEAEVGELLFVDAITNDKAASVGNIPSDSDHKVERATRSTKGNPQKYLVHAVIAVVAVLLIALLSFFFIKDSEEAIAQAQAAVQNLYLNEEETFLKEGIRQEDFDLARKAVNDLTWRQRKPYLEGLDTAQAKFNSLTRLNEVYQSEEWLINGSQKVSQEELVLVSEVSEEDVKALITPINAFEADVMWDTIHSYQDYAIESLKQIELAKESMATLPKEVENRAALAEVVDQVVKLETDIQPLAKHPQMSEVNQLFQEYANTVGQVFVAGAELGEYDPALIEAIYDSKVLARSLVGTAYDRSPLIALTFDDGPNDVYTPQLLDILAKHEVKATFFVMGAYVDDFPEIARRIVAEGHTIANHTYSHPDLSKSTDEEVLLQMEWAQESIEDATGISPDLYRLPFGAGGKRVVDLLPEMTSILWNIDSYDWESGDVEVIYDTIMNQLQHHSLLLMHDTHQATPDTIDRLIPHLKEQGYSFVSPEALDFEMRYFAE